MKTMVYGINSCFETMFYHQVWLCDRPWLFAVIFLIIISLITLGIANIISIIKDYKRK